MGLSILVAIGVAFLPILALLRAADAAKAADRWHHRLDQLERDSEVLRKQARDLREAR